MQIYSELPCSSEPIYHNLANGCNILFGKAPRNAKSPMIPHLEDPPGQRSLTQISLNFWPVHHQLELLLRLLLLKGLL